MELGEPLGETSAETLGTEQSVEAYLDDEPVERPDEPADETDPEEPAAHTAPEPRRPAKKRGRASVPSWDEIMFGGPKRQS